MRARTWRTVGAAAVCAGTFILVTACDIDPVPDSPAARLTPDGSSVYPFNNAWLERQITAGNAGNFGSTVATASCRPNQVDSTGAGSYDCQVTFSDGRVDSDVIITVFSDGTLQKN